MARPVEQIEQDIAKLDQAVATIAQEFHDTYEQYLKALSKAVRQQFILASYHLCTHSYPQPFLQLSLHQRQELQRSLRQLANQTQSQLEKLQTVASEDFRLEAELPEVELPASGDIAAPDDRSEPQPIGSNQPIAPKTLARWQETLEQRIVNQLQGLSHSANCLFQKANLLPNLLPEPVLEVASKADLAAEAAVSPPNLLNLLIESESDEEATMTQVTTIRLRLSEIEFSDATVAVWRSKIRTLLAQLNKVGREYYKKQTEKAIAEAESAWRSSWYEE